MKATTAAVSRLPSPQPLLPSVTSALNMSTKAAPTMLLLLRPLTRALTCLMRVGRHSCLSCYRTIITWHPYHRPLHPLLQLLPAPVPPMLLFIIIRRRLVVSPRHYITIITHNITLRHHSEVLEVSSNSSNISLQQCSPLNSITRLPHEPIPSTKQITLTLIKLVPCYPP